MNEEKRRDGCDIVERRSRSSGDVLRDRRGVSERQWNVKEKRTASSAVVVISSVRPESPHAAQDSVPPRSVYGCCETRLVSKKPGANEMVTLAAEAALARRVSQAASESARVDVPSRKVPETPPEKVETGRRFA